VAFANLFCQWWIFYVDLSEKELVRVGNNTATCTGKAYSEAAKHTERRPGSDKNGQKVD